MSNEIAIVTGGTSGLGFEVARQLLKKEYLICIVGRLKARLNEAKQKLLIDNFNSNHLLLRQCNVGSENDVKELFKYLENNNFNPYLVFNIAGVGRFGDISEIDQDTINVVFEANLTGLILVSSYAIRTMQKNKGGILINIMSTAALVSRPNESVYCAAKWGARGFTEAIKVATKGTTIKVISVYPGGMNTPFWSKDCGMQPKVETFMNPSDVAKKIISAATEINSSIISDITINRGGS